MSRMPQSTLLLQEGQYLSRQRQVTIECLGHTVSEALSSRRGGGGGVQGSCLSGLLMLCRNSNAAVYKGGPRSGAAP